MALLNTSDTICESNYDRYLTKLRRSQRYTDVFIKQTIERLLFEDIHVKCDANTFFTVIEEEHDKSSSIQTYDKSSSIQKESKEQDV